MSISIIFLDDNIDIYKGIKMRIASNIVISPITAEDYDKIEPNTPIIVIEIIFTNITQQFYNVLTQIVKQNLRI